MGSQLMMKVGIKTPTRRILRKSTTLKLPIHLSRERKGGQSKKKEVNEIETDFLVAYQSATVIYRLLIRHWKIWENKVATDGKNILTGRIIGQE